MQIKVPQSQCLVLYPILGLQLMIDDRSNKFRNTKRSVNIDFGTLPPRPILGVIEWVTNKRFLV